MVVDHLRYIPTTHIPSLHIPKRRAWRGYNVRRTGKEGLEKTEMVRETTTTRLPDASEARIVECPVCSTAMTTLEAEGVPVDVCAGGCGGIWCDWFELARVDEVHASAGEKFLKVERD